MIELEKRPRVYYEKANEDELWWCNSHGRRATYIWWNDYHPKTHCCDPKLGGILLPCTCVELTGQVELEESK